MGTLEKKIKIRQVRAAETRKRIVSAAKKLITENGFEIMSEKACTHAGKNYTVILSVYSGKVKERGVPFHYIGMLDSEDEFAKAYMRQVLKKLTFKSNGKKHDGKDTNELDMAIAEIKERFGVDINGDC